MCWSADHFNADIDCKVLVVEGNDVNQMVLQGMLSKIGCQFDCAIHESDYGEVESILMGRQPGTKSPGGSYYREWIESAFEPFNGELFDFGKSTTHAQFKDKDLFSAWQYIDKFQPAANMVCLNRTFGGLYLNLVKLGARAAFPIR